MRLNSTLGGFFVLIGYAVGAMGQIQTVSSTVEIVSALLMDALSIRFRHKALLITDLGFLSISALGCYTAVSFEMLAGWLTV